MTSRHLHVVLALGLAWSLAPDDASASGGIPGGYELAIVGGVIGAGVVVGGLVTDGLVIHDLAAGQGVRRGPAIAGTVLWSFATLVIVPLSIGLMNGGEADAGGTAALLAADALSLGSLGLSIYGLAVGPPRTLELSGLQRFTLHPTVIPSAGAPALGLGVSFAL